MMIFRMPRTFAIVAGAAGLALIAALLLPWRGGSGSLQDRPHALKAKGVGRPG
jgi:hypothetical protein